MSDDKVRAALEALRAEANRPDALDEHTRQHLEHLAADIEARAGQPPDPAQHSSLVQRVQAGIAQFEVTHPDLTLALNEVLAALSGAGV